MNSLTDNNEQLPDIPNQTCHQQLVLPINPEHQSNNNVLLASSNLLSPDIQKEAADYVFQLKTKSRRLSGMNEDFKLQENTSCHHAPSNTNLSRYQGKYLNYLKLFCILE